MKLSFEEKKDAIIIDIDGTAALGIAKNRKQLTAIRHRLAYDYDKCGHDTINPMVWMFMSAVIDSNKFPYKIIFLSGRENVTFPGKSERKDKSYRRAYMPGSDKEYANCYDLTNDWIMACAKSYLPITRWYPGNWDTDWYELYMRKQGDNREDSIVKEEMYLNEIKPKYNVDLVIDDRDQVVKMWRKIGLTCWQVANGNF